MVVTDEIKIKIASANRANPYVDITPYELGIAPPFVNYTGFYPDSDEILIYAAPAATFEDKEQIIGYTGKSTDVNIKIMEGVSRRKGRTDARAIRDTVRQSNMGDLLITSKRIIFVGKDDSFEFQVDKISTVKLLDRNSFVIQSENSSKNVWLDTVLVVYAFGFINYVIDEDAQGIDVHASIKAIQSKMTPEQIALCNQVRDECFLIKVPKPKNKQGCLWGMTKFLWILVAVVVVAVVVGIVAVTISNNSANNSNNSVNNNSSGNFPQYTLSEVLALDNHPKIYDSYENTKAFYDGIGAVKVLTIQEYIQIERGLKKQTDDETLLYFIQDSTDKGYVGTAQINLYDESVSANMTVDKAAELLVSYLPDNFFECYSKDNSYKYTDNNCTVYVYSCRFNDVGVAYHNDGHNQYSYYYSFKITHFEDTNQWKLETDYAAYGDKSLDWIQKYSDEWNIDFKDYVK